MQWNQKIIGHFIQAMQIHPHLDLIGGNYRPTGDGDFSGLFHFENETLFIVKVDLFLFEPLISFYSYLIPLILVLSFSFSLSSSNSHCLALFH